MRSMALGLFAALLLSCSYALAQQQRGHVRELAPFDGAHRGFRGQLGTHSLNNFQGFSSGVPGRAADVNFAPLAPPPHHAGASITTGGLAGEYRIVPQAVLPGPLAPGGTLTVTGRDSGPPPPSFTGYSRSFASDNLSRIYGVSIDPTGVPGDPGTGLPSALPIRTILPAAVDFNLAKQLDTTLHYRVSLKLFGEEKFAEAGQQARQGLVFDIGRPEGEWLVAVSAATEGNTAEVIFRLRNALSSCPGLFAQSAGAVWGLLGQARVRELADALATRKPAGAPASAERLLAAAWLAADLGELDRARVLVAEADGVIGPAMIVANALRSRLSMAEPVVSPVRQPEPKVPSPAERAETSPPGAGTGQAAPDGSFGAAPALRFEQWLNMPAGRSLGILPADEPIELPKTPQ